MGLLGRSGRRRAGEARARGAERAPAQAGIVAEPDMVARFQGYGYS
jgi:hypothetical protein